MFKMGAHQNAVKADGADNVAQKFTFTIKNTILSNITVWRKVRFLRCRRLILALLELICYVDTSFFSQKKNKILGV